jgi:hypothetical protein
MTQDNLVERITTLRSNTHLDGRCGAHNSLRCPQCLSEWANSKNHIRKWFPNSMEPY